MRRTVVDGKGKENVPGTIGVPVQSKISDFFNKRDGDDRERVVEIEELMWDVEEDSAERVEEAVTEEAVEEEEESDFSSQDFRGEYFGL